MSERGISPVARVVAVKTLDERAERRAYWAAQTIEARLREVESLRRLWIEVTGDPDRPIERVVHRRRFGEPAPRPPRR
jgi:hypothetical protein